MAKGRMLNRTIRDDARFNALSDSSGLLFCMTLPWLDRDGIIGMETLWSDVCPRKPKWFGAMDDLIQEWIDSGMVIMYDVGGENALYFRSFRKNQTLTHYQRETESRFPPPPGYERGSIGLTPCESDAGAGPAEVEEEIEVEEKEIKQDRENAGLVSQAYEREIGIISPMVYEYINAALDEYEVDWIIEAISIAAAANKRSWSYVEGILRHSKAEGKAPKLRQKGKDGDNKYSIPPEYVDILIG